jgi:hypothetical protein
MVKTLLFVIFFGAGLCAIAVSALVPDLNQFYSIKIKLDDTEQTNKKIQKLIEDHDFMIKKLKEDPNSAERLATVTLGFEPNSTETAFPKPKQKTLMAAKLALRSARPVETPETVLPEWLVRVTNDEMRTVLFMSGAGLVLVSFVCFVPRRKQIQAVEQ